MQFHQLCLQNLSNVWRKNAFNKLLSQQLEVNARTDRIKDLNKKLVASRNNANHHNNPDNPDRQVLERGDGRKEKQPDQEDHEKTHLGISDISDDEEASGSDSSDCPEKRIQAEQEAIDLDICEWEDSKELKSCLDVFREEIDFTVKDELPRVEPFNEVVLRAI